MAAPQLHIGYDEARDIPLVAKLFSLSSGKAGLFLVGVFVTQRGGHVIGRSIDLQ